MGPISEQVLGAIKGLSVVAVFLFAMVWCIGYGGGLSDSAFAAKCRSSNLFKIEGEQFICVNKEGLTSILRQYEAERSKKGTTPL